ncbi:MAG: hypothetical protein JST30_01730 [Armatimonadetes bacterium]|nr:hypothetical protein [Armatimonadota bacterium]
MKTFPCSNPAVLARNATGTRFAFFNGSSAKLYEYPSGSLLASFPTGVNGKDIAVTSNGAYVVTCNNDGVRVWSAATQLLFAFVPMSGSSFADLTPDESQVVIADSTSATCTVYSMPDLSFVSSFSLPEKPVDIDLSPDGSIVYVSYGAKDIKLTAHNVYSGVETVTFPYGDYVSSEFIWSKTGESFAVFSGSYVRIRRTSDGSLLRSLPMEVPDRWDWSEQGDMVATLTDRAVNVWRVSDGTLLFTQGFAQPYGPYDVALSPDGSLLVVTGVLVGEHGSLNTQTWIFETMDWSLVLADTGGNGYYSRAEFLPSGKLVLQNGYENIYKIYDRFNGNYLASTYLTHGRFKSR